MLLLLFTPSDGTTPDFWQEVTPAEGLWQEVPPATGVWS